MLVWALGLCQRASADQPAGGCRIVAVHVVPPVEMIGDVADPGRRTTTPLGGLSDIASNHVTAATPRVRPADHRLSLWVITDRGPNGTVETPSARRRTLLDRSFVPSIARLDLDATHRSADEPAAARVSRIVPLANRTGRPLSGRPNGVGRDEPILDPRNAATIPPDPDGIDSEGLVRMRNGSFWVAEEYRPSLLEVSPAGRAVARYVPAGQAIPGAGMDVHEVFPAAYGARRDNRGFEALAVSPDETRLWLLLQSPLDHPVAKAAAHTGNVRLLAFDVATRSPVAEYIYRLGDPEAEGFLDRGAPPEDGKLCAIAALDTETLLVLEQSDGGLARLYACRLAGATDTLGRDPSPASDDLPIEQIADLPGAGIVPVGKRLVADLATLLPRMAHTVFSERAESPPPLKLEGMAVLDASHVVIVNDNDFGIHDKSGPKGRPPRTCLWVVELGAPLWPELDGHAAANP